jgi:hypothetical protein
VPSVVEAQLVVGMLQSNGVEAAASPTETGIYPSFQLTEGVRVLVAAEDETEARELIGEADSGRSSD